MSDVQNEFSKFRQKSLKCGEKVAFAVIGGDFNVDNISPSNFLHSYYQFFIIFMFQISFLGDESTHDHPIFNSYDDFPRSQSGTI